MKKVSDLIGAPLDYWVARANGNDTRDSGLILRSGYRPSSEWAHGGTIIERERICTMMGANQAGSPGWSAMVGEVGICEFDDDYGWYRGPTPLIAAMRCYVASKFGDEVPDEDAG